MLSLARRNILFIIIFLIAALLRFSALSTTPPSLSHDEVAIGYNAWSILKTGKDEYGTFMPVLFRSFDDYKLPGYIYSTTLAESVFGLTPFAVRFTSALLGTFTVVVFYFIAKEIFEENEKQTIKGKLVKFLNWKLDIGYLQFETPILAMLILAISPWHVNFSRAAFESNGSFFFIALGLLFLLRSRRSSRELFFAAISFAISLYFYYTARILVPALLLSYLLLYWDRIKSQKKQLVGACILAFVLLLPILPGMFSQGNARVNQVSIFASSDLKKIADSYALIKLDNPNPVNKFIYNTRLVYGMQFIDNYVKNFNLDFFFTNGSGPMGLLYVWEIPVFFFGIYKTLLLKQKEKWFMLLWFFATPIVGGLTVGQPNALRTLPNALPAAFFTAVGLTTILKIVSGKRYAIVYGLGIATCIFFFFLRFVSLYFIYNPPLVASEWGDGEKQMALFVKENMNKYKGIFVSGENWRPYIYFAFYTAYPPEKFQKNGSQYGVENITFGTAPWDTGKRITFNDTNLSLLVKDKTLFLLSPQDFAGQQSLRTEDKVPYQMKVVKEINGEFVHPAFYAVTLQ